MSCMLIQIPNEMVDLADKRLRGKDVRVIRSITPPHLLDKSMLSGITWIGSYSLSNTQHAWFKQSHTVFYDDDLPASPGQAARDYLVYKGIRPSKATAKQLEGATWRRPALVAWPGHYDDHAYIDLTGAFWSIISVTGWGVDYWPGRWLRVSDDVRDYPFSQNKVARNALVSAAILRGQVRVFWKGKYDVRPLANRYKNMILWALVQDVLHSIAWFAVSSCEAKYVNTDGYIVPAKYADRMLDYIAWLGLVGRVVDEGDARVHGVGRYTVGDRETKHPVVHDRAHFNLNPQVQDGWLVNRFRRMAFYRVNE